MAAKSLNPVRGRRPVLQNCTLGELAVDPLYQRSIDNGGSQALIRAIARDWDWGLCQPLVVAQRADLGLFVVDGQHRLAAARLRGDIFDLPCVIITPASAQEEAKTFVALNQARRPLKPLDIFHAAVAGKDPEACRIMSMIAQAGLSLSTTTNNVDVAPGAVSNIGGIRQSLRSYGDKSTVKALRVMARAFDGQVLRYAGTLFGGIAATVGEADKAGTAVSEALIVMVLGGAEQADWYRDIMAHKGKFPDMRIAQAAAHIIASAYEEAAAEEAESVA